MSEFANTLAGLSALAAGFGSLLGNAEATGTALVVFGLVYAAKSLANGK